MFDILDGVSAESTDIINKNGRLSAMRLLRGSAVSETSKNRKKVGTLSKKQPQLLG